MYTNNAKLIVRKLITGIDQATKLPVKICGGASSFEVAFAEATSADNMVSLMKKMSYVSTDLFTNSGQTSTSSVYGGVVFGTGNATPTVDDYMLSGDPVLGLTSSNLVFTSFSDLSDENQLKFEQVYTITNTTDSNMVIGEVGLITIHKVRNQTMTTYPGYGAVLIERTALETPITIPPGGLGTVKYTVAFDVEFSSAATGEVVA